jgi:hypothetical protein
VPQAAIVDAGLLGKVSVQDICLLYYLRGWFNFDGAKIEQLDGRKFVWLHSACAIEELPVLFNPQAKLTSRKNQLSAMIENLRETGLLETTRIGRRLFFRLTDKAVGLYKRHERPLPTVTKSASIVMPSRDETVTPGQDRTVTSLRDEYLPANIDETGIKESERKETPPSSPCEGEAESILVLWNSFPQLLPVKTITANRARKLRKRLADPFWREHWREGVKRVAASDFAKGGGPNGWRATLDWFLGGDSLAKIVEGAYDNRPQNSKRVVSIFELKEQLKMVEKRMGEHACNQESVYGSASPTDAEWDEYQKLKEQKSALVRQISGVP